MWQTKCTYIWSCMRVDLWLFAPPNPHSSPLLHRIDVKEQAYSELTYLETECRSKVDLTLKRQATQDNEFPEYKVRVCMSVPCIYVFSLFLVVHQSKSSTDISCLDYDKESNIDYAFSAALCVFTHQWRIREAYSAITFLSRCCSVLSAGARH